MKETELIALARQVDDLLKDNDFSKAIELTEIILSHNKSAGLAYKGLIALKKDDLDTAEELLLESFQLNKSQNLALANLIPTYLKKKDYKKAKAFGEQAYAVMPKNKSVALNYAAALIQEQEYSKALGILKPIQDENNPEIAVLTALITCYRSLFMKAEAEELLAVAEEHFGDKQEVMRLKGDTLAEGDPEKALAAFKQALMNDPGNIATRWNMSLVQLRLGEFDEGWINYDNGLLPEVGKIGRPLPKLFEGAKRIIDPSEIDEKKWTFAVCEQGIGDQVLFLGCMNKFLKDFPKTILISEKRLKQIFERSFPQMPVYSYGVGPIIAANTAIINGYIPIGSFQKKYRSSKDSFIEHRSPYLEPNQEKVDAYRKSLLEKTGAKKIIGFSWKGGFWERSQATKTMTIDLWEPILRNKDIIFVSLQYGNTDEEKKRLAEKYQNIRWIEGIDFKKDIDSWFALICSCDDIISVSTALVHFAGAAGKSVHLLLSDRGAPFIWGVEGKTSIAYQNVKIYRKEGAQDYSEFFESVASDVFSDREVN